MRFPASPEVLLFGRAKMNSNWVKMFSFWVFFFSKWETKICCVMWLTMTLPAIWCNISSIPIGWRPWFLSKGTKCHAKDASIDVKRLSAAHSFLITLAMAVHKLVEQLPHCVAHQRPVLMVLLHLLLYLATALFTK